MYGAIRPALAAAHAVFALILLCSPLSAQPFARGPQFEISSDAYLTYRPAVAYRPGGGFIVVWESDGSTADDTSGFSIQGRVLGADGQPLGPPFQVNTYTPGNTIRPAVAAGASGILVVWESDGSSGSDGSLSSIQGRLLSSAGVATGEQFQLNVYTMSTQGSATVASLPGGAFVVAWQSAGSNGTDTSGSSIQARRFTADGAGDGEEFQVNVYTTAGQRLPVIAAGPDGRFVVVWESDGSSGTDHSSTSIQGQRYTADGAPVGEEFQVNFVTESFQRAPHVAIRPDGRFTVVWQSDAPTSPVRRRAFGADDNGVPGEFLVNPHDRSVPLGRTSVAVGPEDREVVMWEALTGVRSILIDRYDLPVGEVSQLTDDTLAAHGPPGLSTAPDGQVLAVWSVNDSSVRGQRLSFFCSDEDTLCLVRERFRVEIEWKDFEGSRGVGHVVPVRSNDSGLFWFFSAENWEVLVKVLNGCGFNDHYWVFSAATTDVEYTIHVTDSASDLRKSYFNPLGSPAEAITDTFAFDSCP